MTEILKTRFEFPSSLIQAQGQALESLWEQCSSDSTVVRSACCDALVLLVEQGHADLPYVLNTTLNLLPSARNVQGLIKVVGRLLQIQASQRDNGASFTCPYSIRTFPHPYITVLENRPDCWPALLQEIDDFLQLAKDKDEPVYVEMLVPFLRYLYCEPQRLSENALLRHSLLRVLLQPRGVPEADSLQEKGASGTRVVRELIHSLFDLLPYMLVMVEFSSFAESLTSALLIDPGFWRKELTQLALQLLCACQLSLHLGGELMSLLHTLHQIIPELPPEQVIMGISLLLLSASTSQQTALLELGKAPLATRTQQIDTASLISTEKGGITGGFCSEIVFLLLFLAEFHADCNIQITVPCLLPVLMFKLGRVSDPALSHSVLYTLPKLGTHKFCIPQVLHVLQTLGSSSRLRPVALRLLALLWKKQDRVYPDLQRLMSQFEKSSVVLGKDTQWEQILARAACIRDICRERPYQHGGDMLAAITDTLMQFSRKDQATPAALALEGLQELCRAEVVDIISTWKALSPKLCCDTRPLVLKATAELLALVPALNVKTEEYEARDHHPLFLITRCVVFWILSSNAALETFLTALVRQEMNQMPRGVYHSALIGGNLRSDQGKTVSGIPSFMLKTYEKNKQPGLKPGLAAGLLLCYDLPVQTDKDGHPITRFLVSRGRSYQQMLATLIHEVNIQPSEWHRSLLLPQAWRGFMSRAYHAALKGRKAELEMLQKQGKENPEELQYKQHYAWLWVRDQLTDVVKSAAKDSPVVQGNSILALSGLAVVLTRYESNLPTQSESGLEVGPDFLPTVHWLTMVIDTLLSIVSSNSNPKGQVFPWFIHRSYSGENTASVIARSCAALGLALLVPVLVTSCKKNIPAILGTLAAGLPGSPSADESQALQFHSGLALGMFLAWLHDERISDISGQSVAELLVKHLERLEDCCFNPSLEYNAGCVLGVGLVLSSLSSSSQSERDGVHVSLTLDRLLQTLQDSSNMSRMLQEVLAYSVACVAVSAFSAGIIEASKAEESMNTLRTLTEESQQTPGFALALGLTVFGLSSFGHGKAVDIQPRLLAAWTKILLAEGCPTMQRLSALNGLIALVGSEMALIQIITFSGTIGLQSNGACLLGHLHLAHISSSHSRTAVPQDFGYLSEKSVIRASVDFITEAGRKGPEFTPPHLVKTVLAALVTVGGSFQYPPVNWSAILSPLMRLGFGEEVQHHCLELAASQAQSSQSASLFLGIWLVPPLVHSLSVSMSLISWMKHVAEDKLQVYVDSLAVQQFVPDTRPQRLPLCLCILSGLSKAMAVPNPPQNCWTALSSTTEKIYNLLPDNIPVDLYEAMCSCLSELSDTEIDRIVKANVEKTAFILSYLTSKGRVPLLGLNDVISTILQAGNKKRISWLLLQTLHQSRFASSPNTGVSKRMEWLLELMGHIRNVAYGSPSILPVSVIILQGTDFLLGVFAAAVVSWADHCVPLLIGIRAQWFPWQQSSLTTELSHELYVNPAITELSVTSCLLAIPCSMKKLLAKEPWKSQSQKFIDWLFSITEGPKQGFSETALLTAKATLMALRSSSEFKKKGVWTRAYGW
uniref:Focadhesin n=1 Tax=Cyprinus carpio TaxID=7962 RepID=A0A8C1KKK9_CYPCA